MIFSKPSCIAVALQDAHAFVEARDLDAALRAQRFLEREYLGLAAADQQQFFAGKFLDQRDQRGQSRIDGVVVCAFRRMRLCVGMKFCEQALPLGVVEFAAIEHADGGDATREAADLRTAVAEHHTAGAVAIDQRVEQRGAGRRVVVIVTLQQREEFCVAAESINELLAVARIQCRAIEESVGDRGEADKVVGLGDERAEIAIARRIEQTQSGEVSAAPELLRGRGQQDQAGRSRGQSFDQRVSGAGRIG